MAELQMAKIGLVRLQKERAGQKSGAQSRSRSPVGASPMRMEKPFISEFKQQRKES